MPMYTVSYTFEADNDQEASDIWRGEYYLEADPQQSWTLLPPVEGPQSHAQTCDVTAADMTYGPCPVCHKDAEYKTKGED